MTKRGGTHLRALPPMRPATPIYASRAATRLASAKIECAILSGWTAQERSVIFSDILAHLLATVDDYGKVCIIVNGGRAHD